MQREILATTTAPCGHFQYHQFLMRVFNRILTMKLNEGNLLLTFELKSKFILPSWIDDVRFLQLLKHATTNFVVGIRLLRTYN